MEALLRSATTSSGAPIRVPDGPLELIVSKYIIAPHASLPVHKHLYPRYGYVLSGDMMVTNLETQHSRTFAAGSAIIEDVGTWHEARNLGTKPVTLVVIDLVKHGAVNVILKE